MFYVVYKTENLINGKFYIGYHATNNLDDDYLGSGKNLIKAIKKYGFENFKRTILYQFDNKEDALNKESEIVNDEFINREDTYNLKLGGEGGWDFINNKLIYDIDHMVKKYDKISMSLKEQYKKGNIIGWKFVNNNPDIPNGMLGKKHSIQTKNKISENNGNKLSKEEILNRIEDYSRIDKKRGYIGKLSNKWKISHTQVRRFIDTINK